MEEADELAAAIRMSLLSDKGEGGAGTGAEAGVAGGAKGKVRASTCAAATSSASGGYSRSSAGCSSSASVEGEIASARTADDLLGAEFHFVTECFFLALKAVHVALLPAMRRAERALLELLRKSRQAPLTNGSSVEMAAALKQLSLSGLGPMQRVAVGLRIAVDVPQQQATRPHARTRTRTRTRTHAYAQARVRIRARALRFNARARATQ
eukprot:1952972-Pleurochrysis_carterae.AAC.2